jgi:DNA repair ATPase RecN
VPTEEEVPSKLQGLREYNGDKLVLVHDEDELALEVGYRLARARVLMKRSHSEVDAAAVHDLVERALAAMEDVRRVKSRLSGARTNIDQAYEVVEQMAVRVRGHLTEVDMLVRGEHEPAPEPADDQMEL